MIEPLQAKTKGRKIPLVTLAAAALVLVLALGAAFFPNSNGVKMHGIFLVYNSPGIDSGRDGFFDSLADVLSEVSGHPMELMVAASRDEFEQMAARGVDFILCPDGLALGLDVSQYSQMAAGRRKVPNNLRPRGVVVFRQSLGFMEQPWIEHGTRTVFGDSLSLVSVGGVSPVSSIRGCAIGSDPYDHTPVLHALRLGAFDFALVRQWDAEDFFSSGLLDPVVWGVKSRTMPVPDIVMMASRTIPMVDRLKWADTLALVGRSDGNASDATNKMAKHLNALKLVGFNILLEPDFELVRRNFARNWPVAPD